MASSTFIHAVMTATVKTLVTEWVMENIGEKTKSPAELCYVMRCSPHSSHITCSWKLKAIKLSFKLEAKHYFYRGVGFYKKFHEDGWVKHAVVCL